MAPLQTSPYATIAVPLYSTTNTQAATLIRVDPPMNSTSPDSQASTNQSKDSAYVPTSQGQLANRTTNATRKKQSRASRQCETQGAPTSNTTSLRFFVVDNPDKLKDKHQMRENRKHVMNDYLSKERRKPGSTDVRATGSANSSGKRKRPQSQSSARSENPSAPGVIFKAGTVSDSLQSSASPPAASQVPVISNGTQHSANAAEEVNPASELPRTTPRRVIRFADDETPLVRGIAGGFNNSRYLRTSAGDVPMPVARLGSSLNPFNTWPTLSDPSLDVEQLKWSCSRKFGSRGIVAHWVPSLLKAKHAFLSTICISSSHDDVMMRGLQAPHERLRYGSTDGIKVRTEVISMINDALADPKQQAADATIVAVLHLLNSEVMGGDDQTMSVHQRGLHQMIRRRGGLEYLGVDGELAVLSTMVMYLISALRETEPHADFVTFAAQKRAKPGTDLRQLPESPIYCRMSGYHTITRSIPPEHPTHKLLESLRLLTNSYVRRSDASFISPLTPIHVNASWDQSTNSVLTHRDAIFATIPAEDRPDDFKNASERYQFEAVRLVGLVYAYALANEVPFSKAAAELGGFTAASTRNPTTNPPPRSTSPTPENMSWHLLIKSALVCTNLSDCWGHLAGVLFWAVIVAGACANPQANKQNTQNPEEDEEGRKWLAAIAVRCSIVMGFEHGGPLLETLKRMVGIERSLGRVEGEGVVVNSGGGGGGLELGEGGVMGPRVPVVQGTFSDFAADFMSGCV